MVLRRTPVRATKDEVADHDDDGDLPASGQVPTVFIPALGRAPAAHAYVMAPKYQS